MRELTRKERAAVSALEHAIEHEPILRPVLVDDYGQSRALVHDLRSLLQRRVDAGARHPNEPGSLSELPFERPWGDESRSNVKPGDGLSRYGEPDHTGFCDGVF